MKNESRRTEKASEASYEVSPIPRKVLKISEMAMSVDGEYVGEAGNPSYGEKKGMFEYNPESGLLVTGQKETVLLNANDLVRVPHAMGHVTFKRLLGDKPGVYSDSEFESKLNEKCLQIEHALDKITFLASLLDVPWNTQDTDYCINRAASRNPRFSPEELITTVVDELRRKCNEQRGPDHKECADALGSLERSGALDTDPQKNRESIISYFYLYCRLKRIDAANPDAIYEKGFEDFLFLDELLSEYKRNPDSRFGDALLVACARQQQDWDKETEQATS